MDAEEARKRAKEKAAIIAQPIIRQIKVAIEKAEDHIIVSSGELTEPI